jgi:hypothetical protein
MNHLDSDSDEASMKDYYDGTKSVNNKLNGEERISQVTGTSTTRFPP